MTCNAHENPARTRYDELLEKATYSQMVESFDEFERIDSGQEPEVDAVPEAEEAGEAATCATAPLPRHRGFAYDPSRPRGFVSVEEIEEWCDAALGMCRPSAR